MESSVPLPSTSTLDLPKIIKEYGTIAATYIDQQDFENALESLNQSRELLTAFESQGGTIDSSYWVETFHNSALCYQRLGSLEDTIRCLEECLYFLKDKTPWEIKCHKHFLNTSKNYLEKITKSKYKCKINIQLCAILSMLKRHESALIHAKKAYDRAIRAVTYCYEICKDHLALNKRLVSDSKPKSHISKYKLLESPHYVYFTNLVQFAFPVIKSLLETPESLKVVESNRRTGLSQFAADWLMGFQIGDMMVIDYLDFNELKSRTGIDDEISSDLLLEKICFLTISSYCIGTEVRMLSSQKFSKHTLTDAKTFYLNSVKFAEFLPSSSLLFSHILTTYTKHFGHIEVEYSETALEKSRNKSKTPELEKVYRPKSLKAIKKPFPIKKTRGDSSFSKLAPSTTRKNMKIDNFFKEKQKLQNGRISRKDHDPQTDIE